MMAGAREPTSEVTMDAQAAIIAAVYGYAGGSSGESAGIIHGIAQTSTAEMSTAAKAMMRPLLDAGQADVDHADGGYRQQQYRGDGDAELEKTDDLLVIIGVVGTVP